MYQDPVLSYPIRMGVKLLDKELPGWHREDQLAMPVWPGPQMIPPINLGTLKIDSVHDCILGQLFGSFPKGLACVRITYHSAQLLGFMVPEQINVQSYDRIYEAYTREWSDVISARRAAGI